MKQYLSHNEIAKQLTEEERSELLKIGPAVTSVRPNDLLQKIVFNLVPRVRTIVEIGTYRGLSACVMASCINVEHLYTFDINPSPCPYFYWKKFGVLDKINYICRTSSEKIYEDISKIKFDLAYIDGSHAIDIETEDFLEVKKYCNRVLLDDTDYNPVFNIIKPYGGKRISYRFGYWNANDDYSIVDVIKSELTWDEPYGKRDFRHLDKI